MVEADFNRDGNPDIATLNNNDGTLTLLLGDGKGNFTPAPSSPISASGSALAMATGDFNGDGNPDLALTGGTTTILLGDGTGGFTKGTGIPIEYSYESGGSLIAVGDFNEDGKLDLVLVSPSLGQAYSNVWFGDGTGAFGSPQELPAFEGNPASIAVGDFDGDGKLDLGVNEGAMYIYAGDGTGSFPKAYELTTGPASTPGGASIVSGDFLSAGKSDLFNGAVTWYWAGPGPFPFNRVISYPPTVPAFIVTGDFNGDGKLDWAGVNPNSETVTVELGDGTGAFTAVPGSPYSVGGSPFALAAGDFNGDGKLDLAVDTGSNVVLLLNSVPLTVVSPLTLTCTNTTGTIIVGRTFSSTCSAIGGVPPYVNWSVTSQPSWLTITQTSNSTLTLSGVPPASAVTATTGHAVSFTVQVNDSLTPTPQQASQSFLETVAFPLSLTCSAFGPWEAGVAVVPVQCTVSGGLAPYRWSVIGAIPAGLSLSATTGSTVTLSGIPSVVGTAYFNLLVTDSTAPVANTTTYPINDPIVPAITMSCTPAAGPTLVGESYSSFCSAQGPDLEATYTWSISQGILPAGLILAPTTGASSEISGKPTTSGAYSYAATVRDSLGGTASQTFAGTTSPLAISATCSGQQSAVEVGFAIPLITCSVTGGVAPYTWSIRSGSMPAGLKFSSTTGSAISISGSPTAPGTSQLVLAVTDSTAPTPTVTTVALNNTVVARLAIACSPATGPTLVGQPYSATCTRSGGVPPVTYSPPTLPSGLNFSDSGNGTATISGTPSTAGAFNYNVSVHDSLQPQPASATQSYTGTIAASGGSLSLTCSPPPSNFAIGIAITIQCSVTGGLAPYQWSISSGMLPSGLSIQNSGNMGAVTGSPVTPGAFSFAFQVNDSTPGTPQSRSITIAGTVIGKPMVSAVITASGFGGASAITPGTWAEIYGSNFGSAPTNWSQADFQGPNAPTSLNGIRVSVGGQNAFPSYVSSTQIDVQIPDGISVGGQVPVIVSNEDGASDPFMVTANPVQPALLAAFAVGGKSYLTAVLPDGDYVMPAGAVAGVTSRPAKPGETIVCYGIGFGPVDPPVAAGTIASGASALIAPVQATFGSVPATVPYAGVAPGIVGLYQFNITVPAIADNLAIPFTLSVGGRTVGQTLYTSVQQ